MSRQRIYTDLLWLTPVFSNLIQGGQKFLQFSIETYESECVCACHYHLLLYLIPTGLITNIIKMYCENKVFGSFGQKERLYIRT